MYSITESILKEEAGYEYYTEIKVIDILNLKCIDDSYAVKDCVARMVVKRKCNLAKIIYKRCQKHIKKKVITKRISNEVRNERVKDKNQAFVFGECG